jgi:hypothetical protein
LNSLKVRGAMALPDAPETSDKGFSGIVVPSLLLQKTQI